MASKSDLPRDLIEGEIFPRIPRWSSLGAIRSTCKNWNSLTKKKFFGKPDPRKQFLGFMMMDYKLCSLKFDLEGIRNDEGFVDPLIKQVSIFNQIEVCQVHHCDGLVLCVLKDKKGLVVWNPYLGQTRWIQPRINFDKLDAYALGYDKNRNHKILRIFFDIDNVLGYEVYDLSSDSWNVVHGIPDWDMGANTRGISLKGNTYFLSRDYVGGRTQFLLCFDFTTETFGPPLPLPHGHHNVSLTCVRGEQLGLLYHNLELCGIVEIWVTEKIDPTLVSWTMFLKRPDYGLQICHRRASFFLDEEKKVAVLFDLDPPRWNQTCRYQTAYIFAQDRYYKSVIIGEAPNLEEPGHGLRRYCHPLVCPSSYVPSLVQLQLDQPSKEEERVLLV